MTGARARPHLFSPLRVGPVTLANRIVFGAHLTGYADAGVPGERHVAYYAARAAGGAGLVVTEEHATHPADRPYEKLIRGHDPAVVGPYRRLTDAVHAHGVPVFAQLNHNGGQSSGMYSRAPSWAPSPVADPLFREVPMAVGRREIDEVVAGFARTARHCRDGGFDGVEIQGSQASILRAFLSAATNRREDAYGGPIENRARLLLEVVAAVRSAIGPATALGVRLCGDEAVEAGTTIEEAVAVARLLEASGAVDYLSTTLGVATATLYLVEASMAYPPGYALHAARAIRSAVALPVVGAGRMDDPDDAERALAAGDCDLVGIVRGQIADPDLAAKAAAAEAPAIRPCLACNQDCVGRVGLNRALGCAVNPAAGREGDPVPAVTRPGTRVAVVGGGPGGLQAAVTAAERGHRVTLFERDGRLGGQLDVAARAPGRAGLAGIARYLAARVAALGVDTRLSCEATVELLLGGGFETVVLATGARPVAPGWAGGHGRVVAVADVLAGRAAPEGRVVLYDELGFHEAASGAELLAERGSEVVLATNAMVVAQDLGTSLDLENWTRRVHRHGIGQLTDVVPTGLRDAEGGGVVVELLHHPTGASHRLSCDWVVHATHPAPEDALYRRLRRSGLPVHRVGDCLAPRRLDAAVREGRRVAVAL